MDTLKIATNWAKAESLSILFFIFSGIALVIIGAGFWQMGKTELARAYIAPFLVSGALLIILGSGLSFSNRSLASNFTNRFNTSPEEFVKSEINRADNTMKSYERIAFKIFPICIALAALVMLIVDKPIWRAIGVASIVFFVLIILIDSNAHARLEVYKQQLIEAREQNEI